MLVQAAKGDIKATHGIRSKKVRNRGYSEGNQREPGDDFTATRGDQASGRPSRSGCDEAPQKHSETGNEKLHDHTPRYIAVTSFSLFLVLKSSTLGGVQSSRKQNDVFAVASAQWGSLLRFEERVGGCRSEEGVGLWSLSSNRS
jgi:hypothetical protein